MVFSILGANTESAAYEISNSLRIGPAANSTTPHVNLRRTLGSAGTEETFTFSCWVKLSAKSEYNFWLLGGSQETSSPNHTTYFRISDDARLKFVDSGVGTATNIEFGTRLRDPSAWYHAMIAVDTTQSTASDRVKMYLNGNQETLVSNAYPDQNHGYRVLENGVTQSIGTWIADDGTAYACDDGYISEAYLIDGQQLAPTAFGKTNNNGVWVPKDYSGTYGTHGFRFEFKQTGSSANSSGIGADTSGNDNHFSVNNSATTDVTTDTPTNNFCTMNQLDNFVQGSTFSEGNCQVVTAVSPNTWNTGTFGVANGKWYYELKVTEVGTTEGTNYMNVGWASSMATTAQQSMSFLPYNYAYASDDGKVKSNNTSGTTHGATYGTDIIGVALDLENNTIAFSKNGLWADNSGNSNQSNINGTISIQGASGTPTGFYFPSFGDNVQGDGMTAQLNFGNAPFSISSGNSDANGYGNFEYAVPSGYYALCTKNLAEFG